MLVHPRVAHPTVLKATVQCGLVTTLGSSTTCASPDRLCAELSSFSMGRTHSIAQQQSCHLLDTGKSSDCYMGHGDR